MGICLCEKHGRQGNLDVCLHLGEAVRNGLTIPAYVVCSGELVEDIVLDYYYCLDCVERLHLPPAGGLIKIPEEDEAAEKMLGLRDYLCAGCFNEAVGKEVIYWDA